jgi:hypothetical protein
MNDLSKEIKELKSVNDSLLFVAAELQARTMTLTSMILNVYKETLPESAYKNLYTNYVTELEKNVNDFVGPLSEVVFDQGWLTKSHFELFSAIQHLKDDQNYILNSSNNQK